MSESVSEENATPQTNRQSSEMGTDPVGKILLKQSIPAALGFMVMSVNMLVDRIFVGKYAGTYSVGAIGISMPAVFMIASFGMAIGVGGASIIGCSLGSKDEDYADKTFGNQISLFIITQVVLITAGVLFKTEVLTVLGAEQNILPKAITYFDILIIGIPFLSWAMMSNNVVRAEGKPKVAMLTMAIPAIVNLVLDPIFISGFGWGLKGAAWATTISYVISGVYIIVFYLRGKSELNFKLSYLRLQSRIVQEISGLGAVSLARQASMVVVTIALNFVIYQFAGKVEGEKYVSVFTIISGLMMFAYFPMIGITQGFMPIASYNYGAKNSERVIQLIKTTLLYGTIVSAGVFLLLVAFNEQIIGMFTDDEHPEHAFVLEHTPRMLNIIFLATPIALAQMVGAGYFQAVGKAVPALLLTLTKQVFFLLPLFFIFPFFWELDGIWYSFPVADTLATIVTLAFMWSAVSRLKKGKNRDMIKTEESVPPPVTEGVAENKEPVG